jgi:hypothetical protein
VDEVCDILQSGKPTPVGQEVDAGIREIRTAIKAKTPKRLSSEYADMRSHAAKALSSLQEIFDACEADRALWSEFEAPSGIKTNLIDLILATEDTETTLPRSQELLGALERMRFREDALRPIAQPEGLDQLNRDTYRVTLDLCLIYCWSIHYGYLKIHNRHTGRRSEGLEIMKGHLRKAGIWYTFSPSRPKTAERRLESRRTAPRTKLLTALTTWSVDKISIIMAIGAITILGVVIAILGSVYLDMQRAPHPQRLPENPAGSPAATLHRG